MVHILLNLLNLARILPDNLAVLLKLISNKNVPKTEKTIAARIIPYLKLLGGKWFKMHLHYVIYTLCTYLDFTYTHFFYKQLHFQSQPGVASEILENEAESCLAVACPK